MTQTSNLTHMQYEDSEHVFFRNALQSAFYVHHGATLVDLFVDSDMKFVFVFTKEDHDETKMLWMENKNEPR